MPTYNYKAKSFSGEIKSGKLEVKDEKELASALRQEGYILIYSELPRKRKLSMPNILGMIGRVSLVEKMIFCRYLAVMIKAGLSLTKALEILAKQTKNKTFRKIILEVKDEITRGKFFSESLAKHSRVFSELFCNMIKAGEEGGNLEKVLRTLAYQLEKEHELVSRVRGAMIYPAVIFGVMIAVGILMIVFVIPQFTNIFKEMEIPLPFTTLLLISISKFINNFWYLIPAIILGIIVLGRLVMKTKLGKTMLDRFFLSVPIIGSLLQKINVAKTSRTLGSLMGSGISILRALEITSHTLGNRYYRDALNLVSKNLQKGKGLSESFRQCEKIYPVLFVQLVAIGGETGTLSEILTQLADFYEEEVSNITRNLSSIIEPFLLILMGLAVAFVAISVLQPMYSMSQYIK